MDVRTARRHVRRDLAAHARQRQADPGVIGDPDDRSRLIEAYEWVAEYLAPGETSPLPANLRPLVTPTGTPPDGAPVEWSGSSDDDDPPADP